MLNLLLNSGFDLPSPLSRPLPIGSVPPPICSTVSFSLLTINVRLEGTLLNERIEEEVDFTFEAACI